MTNESRAALRAQLRASLAARVEAAKLVPPVEPAPRYDDAYWAFTAWLDAEPGEPIPLGEEFFLDISEEAMALLLLEYDEGAD